MFNFLKENQIKLVLLGLLNLAVVYSYVAFLNEAPGGIVQSALIQWQDTPSYLDAMYYLDGSYSGSESVPNLQRILTTPFMLLSSMAVGSLFNDYAVGMFALNVALYLISIPIFYQIGFLIFGGTRSAFLATLLYFSSWGIFSFGPTFLADMGGWFFFLLTTLCALRYYRDRDIKKWFYYAVLSSVVGVFFKEYGALGMLSLTLLICISAIPWRTKIKEVAIAVAIFGTALLSYHLYFYLQFNYSYFNWYEYNLSAYAGEDATSTNMYSFTNFIKVVTLIFLPGWPLFLLGLVHLWRSWRNGIREHLFILGALAPASLAFLAWPAFTHRVAIILVPWVALIAAYGVTRQFSSKIVLTSIIIGYAVINYHANYLMAHIDFPF